MTIKKTLIPITVAALLGAILFFGQQEMKLWAMTPTEAFTWEIADTVYNFDDEGGTDTEVKTIYQQGLTRVEVWKDSDILFRKYVIPEATRTVEITTAPETNMRSTIGLPPMNKRAFSLLAVRKCNGDRERRIHGVLVYGVTKRTSDADDNGFFQETTRWRTPELGCTMLALEEELTHPDGRRKLQRTITVTELKKGVPEGIFTPEPWLSEIAKGQMMIKVNLHIDSAFAANDPDVVKTAMELDRQYVESRQRYDLTN